MSNTSTITIACALCVGSARELYLAPALAAISTCVDALVVNDNSGLARSENRTTLEASAFAREGRLRVVSHPFVDFADMRNRAYAELAALERPPDWVLFLDADEVHGEQLRYIAREILPRLGPEIGNVDAYTYHFWGTFRWISDIARRFVFFRYAPDVRWENAVHERAIGVRGSSLVLPYAYHHYGNVAPPAMLARKWGQYYALGNAVPEPPRPETATRDVYLARAADVRPYRAPHPALARATLAQLEETFAPEFALVDAGLVARRTRTMRALARARALGEALRVGLRHIEHPGIYRETTRAR